MPSNLVIPTGLKPKVVVKSSEMVILAMGKLSLSVLASLILRILPFSLSCNQFHIRGDYMKIDVEGVEFLVLQGGNDTLQNYHPIIFLATHSLALKQQCEALLKSFDYL